MSIRIFIIWNKSLTQIRSSLHRTKERRGQNFHAVGGTILWLKFLTKRKSVFCFKKTDTQLLSFNFLNFLIILKPFLCRFYFLVVLWFVVENIVFDSFTSFKTLSHAIIGKSRITAFKALTILFGALILSFSVTYDEQQNGFRRAGLLSGCLHKISVFINFKIKMIWFMYTRNIMSI